jgi:hypothetical protein
MSRKAYREHVPLALNRIPLNTMNSVILSSAQNRLIKKIFDHQAQFVKIFLGSEHNFSSHKFHELCDDQGPTIALCQSQMDQVFGFYTDISWSSNGGGQTFEGKAFLFKILDNELVKFEQNS